MMPCGFLRGVSRNRGPLKNTRQLSCVQLLGRGMTPEVVMMVLGSNVIEEKGKKMLRGG